MSAETDLDSTIAWIARWTKRLVILGICAVVMWILYLGVMRAWDILR